MWTPPSWTSCRSKGIRGAVLERAAACVFTDLRDAPFYTTTGFIEAEP